MLTQSNAEADITRAIMMGADGYLLKSSTLRQLIDGIRTVASEGAIIDNNLAGFVLKTLRTQLPKDQISEILTEREIETIILLADGLSKKGDFR